MVGVTGSDSSKSHDEEDADQSAAYVSASAGPRNPYVRVRLQVVPPPNKRKKSSIFSTFFGLWFSSQRCLSFSVPLMVEGEARESGTRRNLLNIVDVARL